VLDKCNWGIDPPRALVFVVKYCGFMNVSHFLNIFPSGGFPRKAKFLGITYLDN
jgi:hypothetical protein